MPDVDERFDQVEQRLKILGERIDERFTQVDERFTQVDERFTQVDERFAQVDKRLTGLQVLIEDSASQIKLVAEVQGHHGETLQRLNDAVEPLKALQPVFQKVVKDHEERIAALERARQ